jgi:hypothetical protein
MGRTQRMVPCCERRVAAVTQQAGGDHSYAPERAHQSTTAQRPATRHIGTSVRDQAERRVGA